MPLLSLYKELVRRRYETSTRADEIHRVVAADATRVAVKRFVPPSSAPRRRVPVLCVPGLGADSTNFDAPAPIGFAPWLAEQGFDTWVVDLRGTGLSTVPPDRWRGIVFDDFVRLDIPAVLAHIRDVTGSPDVMWVGHSMGGIVLFASVALGTAEGVRAAIALGSPLGFPQGWNAVPYLKHLRHLGDLLPAGLHVGEVSRLLAPLSLRFDHPYLRRFMVLQNVEPRLGRRLMYRAVQSIPRGLALQFRDWIDNDVVRSADRSVDYRARCYGATLPLFVVGAPEDGLARLDAVRRALDIFPNARFFCAGREGGLSVDYGHIDMLLGTRAHEEIYPRLCAFLVEQSARIEAEAPRLRAVPGGSRARAANG